MNKKITLLILLCVTMISVTIEAKTTFDSLLYDEISDELESYEGFVKLIDFTDRARKKYMEKRLNEKDYLKGKIRYGIIVFDDLKNNFDAYKTLSYTLSAKTYDESNNEDKLIAEDRVKKFFVTSSYDEYNVNNILLAMYRLSFTIGKNHEILNIGNTVKLDEVLEKSTRLKDYPLLVGDLNNVCELNGRSGQAMLPLIFTNYFINQSSTGILKEGDIFKRSQAMFFPVEISSCKYITLDDAWRIISGNSFIGINLK